MSRGQIPPAKKNPPTRTFRFKKTPGQVAQVPFRAHTIPKIRPMTPTSRFSGIEDTITSPEIFWKKIGVFSIGRVLRLATNRFDKLDLFVRNRIYIAFSNTSSLAFKPMEIE